MARQHEAAGIENKTLRERAELKSSLAGSRLEAELAAVHKANVVDEGVLAAQQHRIKFDREEELRHQKSLTEARVQGQEREHAKELE